MWMETGGTGDEGTGAVGAKGGGRGSDVGCLAMARTGAADPRLAANPCSPELIITYSRWWPSVRDEKKPDTKAMRDRF